MKGINKVVSNIRQLEDELPNAINECLKYFPNVDRSKTRIQGARKQRSYA